RDDPEDDRALVLAEGTPADGDRAALEALGEVVLLEGPGGDPWTGPDAAGHGTAATAGEHAHDLVGVDETPAARLDDPALVLAARLERLGVRLALLDLHARAGEVGDHELDRARRARRRLAVEHLEAHEHLLEAEVARRGREPARERPGDVG